MSISAIIMWALVIVLALALVGYLLRRAGFTVNKIKAVIPGVVEVEAGRPTEAAPDSAAAAPAHFSQEATGGGVIHKGKIEAPAGSAAGASQKASGPDSRLDDVEIRLE